MDLTFLHPAWFWLLPLAALPWFVPRRAVDTRHAALRSLLLVLLVLGLARPVTTGEERVEHHVFVLDSSASVPTEADAEARERFEDIARSLPQDAERTLVRIGLPGSPEEALDARLFPRVVTISDDDESSLAAALEAAARAIPAGAAGALTLASDGLSTDARHGPVAIELSGRGLPVHTLAIPPTKDDLALVALEPRGLLRVGHGARVLATVAGSSPSFSLILDGPDGELARLDRLSCDGRASFLFEFEPRAPGFVELSARLAKVSGDNRVPSNDRWTREVAVQDPLEVLYLGQRISGAPERLSDLVGPGYSIAHGPDAEARPFEEYDLVLLDDRPASAVPDERQRALAEAVTGQGTGLLVAGGEASFGPGGWNESSIAELLPVEATQKEEKRDPSTTLVVIVDTSGSMGGNRVQLAKEVARLAMRRLLPHDKVGIVEFYGAKRWAAPIQPASNTIELQRALNRLDAGGGTVILPAIEESFYALQNVRTRYKHVLVLTDGGVERGSFEPLIRQMAEKGMTVSTVLVGPDAHSEFLVDIATWGKGRFYSVPNRFNLPEVVLKSPTSARLPAYRPGVHQVRARELGDWWDTDEAPELPPVSGYVETRARPGAEVVVETVEGEHPLLASWSYGLGRVSTLTTEPVGPGTEGWREWPGYGALMARVLARGAGDATEAFSFQLERDDRVLTLRAARRGVHELRPTARFEGDGPTLEFRERAPGLFLARALFDPDASARVLAGVEGAPERRVTRLVSPARYDRAPELGVDPASALDLNALARATGGRSLALAEAIGFVPTVAGAAEPRRVVPLWPWVLALALLCYLADLLYRRRPDAPAAL